MWWMEGWAGGLVDGQVRKQMVSSQPEGPFTGTEQLKELIMPKHRCSATGRFYEG